MVVGGRTSVAIDSDAPELPSGWVTFVFTDIVNSGLLLRRLGERADAYFDRHDEILRRAWNSHGGHEVNTEGDLFFVAFDDVTAALAACAAAQRELAAEPWPDDGEIRVRMGVHAGYARPRAGDYRSLAVHQASRVVSAAGGGQILVTATACGPDQAPSSTALHELGRYRVRDFDQPEMLYRLDPHGFRPNRDAIRATPADRHNLLAATTSFHGRAGDVDDIRAMLRPGSVVSLVGPGGIGKTRLASELGLQVAQDWRDGVWFVELAEMADSSMLADVIAETIGAGRSGSRSRIDDLTEHFADRQLLLILDSCEAHVGECAALLTTLLPASNGLCVMTTGREPINMPGESVHRLAPLESKAAVELFIERARAGRASLLGTDEGTRAIAGICTRLDGVPLALEIAASKVAMLPPEEILTGLDDRFRLLRSRDSTLPERHRTMTALLEWSHNLLDESEQRAWCCLSAFASTFSLAGAEAAFGDDVAAPDDVPELVWRLVDKSLVETDHSESATRYRLPESVREFGRRRADEHDRWLAAVSRLSAWYLDRLGPWLVADQSWISNARLELPNLRGLIDQLAPFDVQTAQKLACTIGQFRQATQALGVGIDELSRLAVDLPEATPAKVAMLAELADMHLHRAEVDLARDRAEEAARLLTAVGAPSWNESCVERTRGEISTRTGDPEAAIEIAESALARRLSPRATGRMANMLGIAHYIRGDLDAAMEALELELAKGLEVGQDGWVAVAHSNIAELQIRRERFADAASHQARTLELALELDQPVMQAYSFMIAGRLASSNSDWTRAALLHASGEAILERVGQVLYDNDLDEVERFWTDVDDHLAGSAGGSTSGSSGGRLTLDTPEAVEMALNVFTSCGAGATNLVQ
jgi:predicted ATPase/class 3 adenylate cyclase